MSAQEQAALTASAALDRLADRSGATISVWAGGIDGAAWLTRLERTVHHAASTMKLPLAVAVLRAAERRRLSWDATVEVRATLPSVVDGSFVTTQDYDNDDEPWRRLGEQVGLWWLVERSIIRSSNLATNLLIDVVGIDAVNDVYARCGVTDSRLRRGIQDRAAGAAGLYNTATAADLAAVLLNALEGRLLRPDSARRLEAVLAANEWRDGLPAGLPAGTYVAHKSGWIDECCHDVGLVRPTTGTPFVASIFTTTTQDEEQAHATVAAAARIVWAHRDAHRS